MKINIKKFKTKIKIEILKIKKFALLINLFYLLKYIISTLLLGLLNFKNFY